MTPEFSRPIDAATVSDSARRIDVSADEAERRRLAGRFRLLGLDSLEAAIDLQRRAGVVHAEGRVTARAVQACVVTGEPMPAAIDAPVSVRFVEEVAAGAPDEEVELSAVDCDTLPIEDGRIDVGELAAETLALALDPYPRSSGADAALREAGMSGEAGVGPFAALQALKDKF